MPGDEDDALHTRRFYANEPFAGRAAPFIHLLAIGGPHRKREFLLGPSEDSGPNPRRSPADFEPAGGLHYTLGANASCDLALPQDERVSPLHARLQMHASGWWLIDCDSQNGTWMLVEDKGRMLELGDSFRAARTEMQLFGRPDLAATL